MKKYIYESPVVVERKEGRKWIVCAVITEGERAHFMEGVRWIAKNAVGEIVASRRTYGEHICDYYKTTNTTGGYDFRVTLL